jgi:hypothetical protein
MPFGRKSAGDKREIDFDKVYELIIKPAIEAANLEPLRADEELTGGIIHKPMFERLILCEYAIADLTTANANVFYELGIRHATRGWATQLLFAEGYGQRQFDVMMLRAFPYKLNDGGEPIDIEITRAGITERLKKAQVNDSPIFQLVENFPEIQHLKTDVFRDRVKYAEDMKRSIAEAREKGVHALIEIEKKIGDIAFADAAVVIDLYLSYRAVKAWNGMINLYSKMALHLAATVMLREQLGLALNRAGKSKDAENVLKKLIEERGGTSESYGILGRVYKDRWEKAKNEEQTALAGGLLDKAIETYVQGFESDWRDPYPGVNAVTLMEMKTPVDPRQKKLLPVVRFAVEKKIEKGQPDYWDYATILELAVLERDAEGAHDALCKALAVVREPQFELETTARNLNLIRNVRFERGESKNEIEFIEKILTQLLSL